jgi:uncharacterized 2Fe-2S/4Fe-4S cluster protein (DUF4445 family)
VDHLVKFFFLQRESSMDKYVVEFRPDDKKVTVHEGCTILEAAGRAGIIINTPCGGKGTCGKCKVLLGDSGEEVLACQYEIKGDTVVEVPRSSRYIQQKILEHGIERQIEHSPNIYKVFLENVPKDLDGLKNVLKSQGRGHLHFEDLHIADKLEKANLQYSGEGVTVTFRKTLSCAERDDEATCYRVMCIEIGDTRAELYGIAVDVGTTTVVSRLINLHTGQSEAMAAMANPQIKYGDDVISRISFAETEEGYQQLHGSIIEGINTLVERLCNNRNIISNHIYEVTAAGNTTMSHLMLNFPVKQLGQAPYEAYSTKCEDLKAEDIGIRINPCGNVHIIENIAGFVGSDTVAVAVAVSMDQVDKMTLVVDIGTNGELILGTKDEMYSASCAAGPALEGARISQGSRAVDGAIEKVSVVDGDIDIEVIGDVEPVSICGSGIVDTMAVLLELGLIDSTGRLYEPEELEGKVSEAILKRLVKDKNGQRGIVLSPSWNSELVVFTQKDVRETQLAKAAIRAGIKILQKKLGINDGDVEQVLLAGAFGNYIRRSNAWRIGLLPDVPHERINYVGNSAATGAQMVLLSSECREIAKGLADRIHYVEVAHETEFQMIFAECLMFEN